MTPRAKSATRTSARGSGVPSPGMRGSGKELGPRANQTIATILDAARQVFLARGFAGTRIDEITKAAGVSRASFYTYFPTKRDALLALGADAAKAAIRVIRELERFPPDWQMADLDAWVDGYFGMLDEHGSFAFAWTQAAHDDDEIRRSGMQGHLHQCRRMGSALARLGRPPGDSPVEAGLLVSSMLERSWVYCQLYSDAVEAQHIRHGAAEMIAAIVGRSPDRAAPAASNGRARRTGSARR